MPPTTTAPPPAAPPYPWTTAGELGDEIARISAYTEAATYRKLVLIRAFDEMDGWGARGFRSCADWLSWRIGVTPGTAREQVRVATPENEAELVEVALGSSAAQMEKLVSAWRQTDRVAEAGAERERHRSRQLSVVRDASDGSWVVHVTAGTLEGREDVSAETSAGVSGGAPRIEGGPHVSAETAAGRTRESELVPG